MTFEYKGAHPHPPRVRGWWYWNRRSSAAEEETEEVPVVAELRLAVAKEEFLARYTGRDSRITA